MTSYTVIGTWNDQDGATTVATLPGAHTPTLSDDPGVWFRIVQAPTAGQAADMAMDDVDESSADAGRLIQDTTPARYTVKPHRGTLPRCEQPARCTRTATMVLAPAGSPGGEFGSLDDMYLCHAHGEARLNP